MEDSLLEMRNISKTASDMQKAEEEEEKMIMTQKSNKGDTKKSSAEKEEEEKMIMTQKSNKCDTKNSSAEKDKFDVLINITEIYDVNVPIDFFVNSFFAPGKTPGSYLCGIQSLECALVEDYQVFTKFLISPQIETMKFPQFDGAVYNSRLNCYYLLDPSTKCVYIKRVDKNPAEVWLKDVVTTYSGSHRGLKIDKQCRALMMLNNRVMINICEIKEDGNSGRIESLFTGKNLKLHCIMDFIITNFGLVSLDRDKKVFFTKFDYKKWKLGKVKEFHLRGKSHESTLHFTICQKEKVMCVILATVSADKQLTNPKIDVYEIKKKKDIRFKFCFDIKAQGLNPFVDIQFYPYIGKSLLLMGSTSPKEKDEKLKTYTFECNTRTFKLKELKSLYRELPLNQRAPFAVTGGILADVIQNNLVEIKYFKTKAIKM